MRPADRREWIRSWLAVRSERMNAAERVDVLFSSFVEDYIEATGAKHSMQMFGAPICRQLGHDLGAMFKEGTLSRHAQGLGPGDSSMGFPKWVWVYRLTDDQLKICFEKKGGE